MPDHDAVPKMPYSCSFCGHVSENGERMIAGGAAVICSVCVAHACNMMVESGDIERARELVFFDRPPNEEL